jgi:hypothetical protein
MAGVGGIPFEKSSGFVISITTTTFSAKFFSPDVVIALGVSSHRVAIPTISPNAAASPKAPCSKAILPCLAVLTWLFPDF